MSKKYKEAMDKIVLSDELKTKIMENTAKNRPPAKTTFKHTKSFYLRHAVGYAACLLLCMLAVSINKNFTETDIMSSAPDIPGYVSPLPEPTDAIRPGQPTNDILPENNPIEYQNSDENVEQNTMNYHIATETQRLQSDNIASSPETPTLENNASISSENHSLNEEISLESSPGNEDNQVVSSTNPSSDPESFSDIREQLGYDFKVPQYLPEGYALDTVSLMFGSLVQISYLSKNDEIIYRTEKTDADISGDYNVYDTMETVTINNIDTNLKSTDEMFYGAVWNDGNMAYSLNSTNGVEKDTMIKIVESTDYPIEPTEEVYEESIVIGKNSTEQYDENTSDQPTEDIYDEEENNGTPEESEQIDTVDNMD